MKLVLISTFLIVGAGALPLSPKAQYRDDEWSAGVSTHRAPSSQGSAVVKLSRDDLTTAAPPIDNSNPTFHDMTVVLNAILIYAGCLSGQGCQGGTDPTVMQAYFSSVIEQYRSGKALTTLKKPTIDAAIGAVVQKAKDMKGTLLAELSAAAAAQAVVAAAEIASAALEFAPFVNLGLDATALAAIAAATALQFEAAAYEKTVVAYIGAMNVYVSQQPGMEAAKTWTTAQQYNAYTYPKFGVGVDAQTNMAIMYAIPSGIVRNNISTIDEMDSTHFVEYIRLVGERGTVNYAVLQEYLRMLAQLPQNVSDVDLTQALETGIAKVERGVPLEVVAAITPVLDLLTVSLAMKDFNAYYQLRKSYAAVTGALPVDPNPNDSEGSGRSSSGSESPEEWETIDLEESSFMERTTSMGDALRGLSGVAMATFSIVGVVGAVDVGDKLASQIDSTESALRDYYAKIANYSRTP